MQNRFHIEELVDQDESGVVFRAVDSETGTIVAVRRFFPFGAGGGGLNEDEQAAYQIAISRLASLRQTYPNLEGVIIGKALYEKAFTLEEAFQAIAAKP